MNMEALLVIDMQKGSFRTAARFRAAQVTATINTLARAFRGAGNPVIYIQHDGSAQGSFHPGTPDWELLDELDTDGTDTFIGKTANDSFYRTELEGFLQARGIRRLVVTGCATDYCVNATIHGALTRDYDITVVGDGHTTADRPLIKARKLVEFHNWLWADLTPTRGRITVRAARDILPAAAR
jgi:nicotinamidase-related amidase